LHLATHLLLRWIEFSNKYRVLLDLLKKHVESCALLHQLKDLPWTNFDFDVEEKIALERERTVTDRMVQMLPYLKTQKNAGDLPDYFGQALTTGFEACYEACEKADVERLKKILPAVFDASLAAYDMTREKVKDLTQDQNKIIYPTEPLINLFEISGYGKLYAELYQKKELWDVIQHCWDFYLSSVNAGEVIKFIANVCNYRDGVFMIMPQASLRTRWQIIFGQHVRDQGFPVFPDESRYEDSDEPINHASTLIRALVRMGGMTLMTTARNVFFATYLSKHAAAKDADLPDKQDLQEKIEEESKPKEATNNDNENEI
jgi:hypothetical protein